MASTQSLSSSMASSKTLAKKALTTEGEAREKKVQKVMELAQEADKALEAIAALSPELVLGRSEAALARTVVRHYIAALGAELGKAEGRNPATMLSCTQELAKVWPQMGG